MRFDILSNRPAAEQAMREDLLKKKYKAKEEQARAATIRAQAAGVTALTGAKTAERQYGPEGLVGQELERRYPMGLPERQAETARISATGYAGAATRGAATAEERLGLEREEFEYGKRFLEGEGGLPGSEEARGKEVAKIRGKLEGAYNPCPEGFTWDGQQCVPSI